MMCVIAFTTVINLLVTVTNSDRFAIKLTIMVELSGPSVSRKAAAEDIDAADAIADQRIARRAEAGGVGRWAIAGAIPIGDVGLDRITAGAAHWGQSGLHRRPQQPRCGHVPVYPRQY